jgi:uncharacterized membrane protein (UPF0127 family)
LKTSKLLIKDKSFTVLVAETDKEKEMGLMFVPAPPPIMCFPYSKRNLSFWMKNTPCPLDIIFCCDGKITNIKQGEPYSTALINGGEADLVIETPKGYCSNYGFKPGDSVKLD